MPIDRRAMDVHGVPQCAAMCLNVPQCAAVCRSVPQCAAVCRSVPSSPCCVVAHCAALCRTMPHYAALCRSEIGRAHGCAMGIEHPRISCNGLVRAPADEAVGGARRVKLSGSERAVRARREI